MVAWLSMRGAALPPLLLACTLLQCALGECPNACSGHGFCDFFDMCSCFRGWTSGDCSIGDSAGLEEQFLVRTPGNSETMMVKVALRPLLHR